MAVCASFTLPCVFALSTMRIPKLTLRSLEYRGSSNKE